MAKPILVANWKNYPGSLAEAKFLLKELGKKRLLYKKVNLFIVPPLPYFEAVSEKARGFAQLGAQDFFPHSKVTITGSVTPEILKSFGVRLAIIGHSERRALGETAEQVSEKMRAALKAGIVPVVCFGEQSRDADGEYFDVLRDEIKSSLAGLGKKDLSKIILAYEPIWAIGKGAQAIDAVELSETIVFIKKVLTDLFGRSAAESSSILYGGSVDELNAGVLLRNSGINGFLVGRASLNGKTFEAVTLSMITK